MSESHVVKLCIRKNLSQLACNRVMTQKKSSQAERAYFSYATDRLEHIQRKLAYAFLQTKVSILFRIVRPLLQSFLESLGLQILFMYLRGSDGLYSNGPLSTFRFLHFSGQICFPLILQTFVVIFSYYLTMRHLNDQIKTSLDLRWANHQHEPSKTEVPKDGSVQ